MSRGSRRHSIRSRRRGTVAAFDANAGYGSIDDDHGSWWFHCTAVAGKSRTIPAGTVVDFALRAGRRGRWEAVDIRPVA